MWVLVDTGVESTLYACVYRSHTGDRETTRLFEHLSEMADEAQRRYPTAQLVLLGDFNAHHKEWLFPFMKTDHAGREARKFALSLNLTQLVQVATRVPDVDGHTANCLDLLLTTDPEKHSISVTSPLGSSDHSVVKSVSVFSPPVDCPVGTRRVWRYKSADWDEMRHFFSSYPWRQVCFSSGDPSCSADAVVDVIRQGMEYFIPFSDIPLGHKARPWYNADCARAEARKESAYQAWVLARDRKVRSRRVRAKKRAYNSAAKSYKRVLRRARFDHVSRIGARLASYPPGGKQFWSLSKAVESNFCRPSLPPLLKPDGSLAHSAAEKANLFATLFASNSRLDAGSKQPPTLPCCDSSMPKIAIHTKEVRRALQNLDVNKASGPDGIPARVLKHCAPELSPILTRLYRLSIRAVSVPKSWKLANVQPVPKKGSRADPCNYRPIAITSILCKVMERVLNSKLLSYLEAHDLLSDHQYGFRRRRSTGDLLAYVTHCWGEAIENHGEALAVSLDISKAFDRVWHASLLSKLPAYGIPSDFCNWILDFLSERSIRVVVDGCSSDLMAINAGVPQGSVLSATLFLLHINDLLSPGIVAYADDSTVIESYQSSARDGGVITRELREAMVERTNATLSFVSRWGDENLVEFNSTKTQACLFSSTLYACVYRSHTGDRETTRLFEHLSEMADEAQRRYPTAQLVLLGDFNAHHKEWLFPFMKTDHAGREARKFALSLNLTQLVQVATRVPDVDGHTANCLDLLLTTDPEKHSISVTSPLGSSDHSVVKSVSVFSPPVDCPVGTRRVWRYKSADWDEMRHFFSSYPWRQVCFSSGDPSCSADAVVDVIRQGMEYFIPFSDIPLGHKARPWYNADCARAEARKESAYQAWVLARDRKVRSRRVRAKKRAYNSAAKSYKRVLRRARFDHVSRIGARLASYPPGGKQFWSLSKAVESNFCRPSLPPLLKPDGSLAHSAAEKANLFATLFASNSRLDAGSKQPPTLPCCDSSMPKIAIHTKEVRRALQNLDVNKASGPDGIPARVLKHCAPELSPILTRLYRLSIRAVSVPKSWKLANVQPVPKKGSRADPCNYRPIAITSILCKVMERVLNSKLLSYLEAHDLLSDHQYGFRRRRSTGDLLAYVTHCWGEAIENHGEALAVSLDISKAFDRVWHASLLSKLPAYGIPSDFCNWILDFLSERSIRVVVDGCSSDLMAINAGVPQGSVLSATLFLLHINDLLSPGIVAYADDSTVIESYQSSARDGGVITRELREAMVERTNATLSFVSRWGDENLVEFNSTKTQACLFSVTILFWLMFPSLVPSASHHHF
ncbi:hypothetical protein ABMA28_003388 [Loxostege sticticalis]|uniref:Reverse transcriptase domain-containing protein n=1 Tax=Loxostege sticticalis TaxID=481309 RepID=A0ABD0SVZ0_LOXSC